MSSKTKTAEQEFREAFERLKTNKPERLEKGSEVTQNNVAREAGRDPSSLRKERYPTLIYEIQAYTTVIRESSTKKKKRSVWRQLSCPVRDNYDGRLSRFTFYSFQPA